MARFWFVPHFLIILILGGVSPAQEAANKPLEFHITFDPLISSAPFTGRVLVMVSKQVIKDAPSKPKWFNPDPIFALDVKDWKPGTKITLGDNALGFPEPLSKLAKRS